MMTLQRMLMFAALSGHLLLSVLPATAQYTSDTLSAPRHILQQTMLEYTLQAAAGLQVQPYGNFRGAELTYGYTYGTLRHPQEAHSQQYLRFSTRGIQQLKRWKLYGHFNYARTFTDSLPWDMRTLHSNGKPYYMAAEKPGNWDNELYLLQGTAVYRISLKWHAGGSSSFKVYDAARSNDPRPFYRLHQMHFEGFAEGQAGWVTVSAGGSYGYASDNADVLYSNEHAFDKPSEPAYITYEFMGYGYIRSTIRYHRTLESANSNYGAYLQLSTPVKKGALWMRYHYQRQTDTVYRQRTDYTNNVNLIAQYRSAEHRAILGFNHQNEKYLFRSLLYAGITDGEDRSWVQLKGANNYLYRREQAHGLLTLQRDPDKRTSLEYGLSLHYLRETKNDGVTQHAYHQRTLRGEISCLALFKYRTQGQWLVHAMPEIVVGQAGLDVPESQINLFTHAVAYPEVRYHNMPKAGFSIKAGYIHHSRGGMRVSALLAVTGKTRIGNAADEPMSRYPFHPHGSRQLLAASLMADF